MTRKLHSYRFLQHVSGAYAKPWASTKAARLRRDDGKLVTVSGKRLNLLMDAGRVTFTKRDL